MRRHRRPGDQGFLQGSIDYMTRESRNIAATHEASAVGTSARALLLEHLDEHLMSVDSAWMLMEDGSWMAQRRAKIVVRLVTSLPSAHDKCLSDVRWPIPAPGRELPGPPALSDIRDHRSGGSRCDHRGGGGEGSHGSSHGRSGGGDSSGGGSSRDSGSRRRTGGGGGGSGGGGYAWRGGPASNGSRRKGGHGHSSSDGHEGHRGHSEGSSY